MTKQIINIGNTANDKKGDSLRAAFQKVNANFTELYVALGLAADVNLNLGNFVFTDNILSLTNSNGDDSTATQIEIAQPVRIESNLTIGGDLLPNSANGGDLGSSTRPWRSLYVSNNTIYLNNVPLALDEVNNLTVDGVPVNSVGSADWSAITNKPTFSDAATSGAWGDITGKPSILTGDDVIGFTTSDTITEETPGGTVSQTTSYQNQIIVDTTDTIRVANILTQTVNDGVVTTTDSVGSTIDIDGTGIYIKRYVEPDGPNNSSYFQFSTSNSGAIIEGVNEELVGNTYGRVTVTQGVVAINVAAEGLDKQWSFNSGGEFIVPEASTILGTNDLTIRSQVNDTSSGLFLNGNPLVGTAILYANKTAIIRSDNNGNPKDWDFDRLGTLTTPSLLPRAFTATVDADHYAGEGSLTLEGDAWYFAVEFRVNANGTVETVITNDTPWPSNPGYAEEMPFEFTEADHGIPGYTFGLSLRNLIEAGPAGWTTNLTATIPPALPATIKNPEAVKITADATSWTFGADGSLAIPGIIKQGGARLNLNENDAGTVYLTSSANDTTALYMPPNNIQLYADIGVSVIAGTVLNGLEAVYNNQLGLLNEYWIQVSGEPGYPWGVTEPLSQNTYDQLVALNPGTISNQTSMTSKANDVKIAWTEWQNALQNTNVGIVAGSNEWVFTPDGKMKLPAGGDIVDSTGTSVLGGAGADLGLLKISGSTIGTKNDPDSGGWGDYSLYLDPGGESFSYIQIPSVEGQTLGATLVIANNNTGNGGIRLSVQGGELIFTDTGIDLPYNLPVRQNNSWTKVSTPSISGGVGIVVWSSTVDYISSAKLIIQVEGDEVGDSSGWHSQACEAIISCRGYANTYGGPGGDPQMVVYGVVHTSVDPLVTFTVQRNPTTKLVEIVATPTAASSGSAALRIHSVEMSTRD